jgi:hypothetical protein
MCEHPKVEDTLANLKGDKESGEVIRSLLKVCDAVCGSIMNAQPAKCEVQKAEEKLEQVL